MDYEKSYKEALKVIESLYNVVKYQSSSDALLTCQTLEKAFPELKESEDEKVRKELISFVRDMLACHDKPNAERDEKYESWLSWLEKQGENNTDKIIERARTEKQRVLLTETNGDAHIDWDCRNLQDVKLLLKYGLEYIDTRFKKQSEQESTDKIEPKFKVGDKIIHKELGGDFIHNPHKIIQVDMLDKKYRLEDGLVAHFSEEDDWELVEQKPAWSREDERTIHLVCEFIRHHSNHNDSISGIDCPILIERLKSLKDRVLSH